MSIEITEHAAERMGEMVQALQEHGFRLTPQRMAVLRILASSYEHPTVEQMYDQVRGEFPMTSLATIYKTVTVLKEVGQVLELGSMNGAGNRYDGVNPVPHAHLVCTDCGKILDLDLEPLDGMNERVETSTGYRITHRDLSFRGICPDCRSDVKA